MPEVQIRKPRIGIIVPSGSVIAERVGMRVLGAAGVDPHFTRVPVRGSVDPYAAGYDLDAFVAAATLLADARPNLLIWAGSKGVLAGVNAELELKVAIEGATGIPFTSSALALVEKASTTGLRSIALVTPYTHDYQQRLIVKFAELGLACVAERHGGIADNLAYADMPADDIAEMALDVANARPDAILAWCTNFAAADCAAQVSARTPIPFYDANLLVLEWALQWLASGSDKQVRSIEP